MLNRGIYLSLRLLCLTTMANALSSSSSSSSSSQQQQHPTSTTTCSSPRYQELQALYRQARQVRCEYGHEAACELYRELLFQKHTSDRTMATHLAALPDGHHILQQFPREPAAGRGNTTMPTTTTTTTTTASSSYFKVLRDFFRDCHYTPRGVAKLLLLDQQQPSSSSRMQQQFEHAPCPLFVTPAAAGTVDRLSLPFMIMDDDDDDDAPLQSSEKKNAQLLSCLVALFLVGLTLPCRLLETVIEPKILCLWKELGILVASSVSTSLSNNNSDNKDDDWHYFSCISIYPVDLSLPSSSSSLSSSPKSEQAHKNNENLLLWIATDWHPRILSTTQINAEEEAVMYLGPDSMALVEHYTMNKDMQFRDNTDYSSLSSKIYWLDLCTGSGIQALAALKANKCSTAVCVDTNPRALRFCRFNAQLNGFSDSQMVLVQGDLLTQQGKIWSSESRKEVPSDVIVEPLIPLLQRLAGEQQSYHIVTANPPFLPVPPDILQRRHGLFSAGGSTGELVLAAALDVAQQVLMPSNGFCALVSEFFFTKTANAKDSIDEQVNDNDEESSSEHLLERLDSFWNQHNESSSSSNYKMLLLTNEFPISAQVYAQRRADSPQEYQEWMTHLRSQGIVSCSPGLLYVQKCSSTPSLSLSQQCNRHVRIPKGSSSQGSIWTPGNADAVAFTQRAGHNMFFDNDNL